MCPGRREVRFRKSYSQVSEFRRQSQDANRRSDEKSGRSGHGRGGSEGGIRDVPTLMLPVRIVGVGFTGLGNTRKRVEGPSMQASKAKQRKTQSK